MSKYDPLNRYLSGQTRKSLMLQMKEIARILGDKLPESTHRHGAWWSNGTTHHPQCRAWMDNGYQTVNVKRTIRQGYIEFKKL